MRTACAYTILTRVLIAHHGKESALAKQHGGAFIGQGYKVSVGTAASPKDQHATWNINYSKDGGKDAPLSVVVDANTGKVESVMKH